MAGTGSRLLAPLSLAGRSILLSALLSASLLLRSAILLSTSAGRRLLHDIDLGAILQFLKAAVRNNFAGIEAGHLRHVVVSGPGGHVAGLRRTILDYPDECLRPV